ncbi:GlxA family transcriptional regulator [Pseudomonas corrugata]|uniref:GlxA family transcriptional regulator n=1 Tax=Pseudomonas corrugata TaxID=47879 RepID=UPI0006D89892|nr:DJ-1/PfpI family protein [Pseudomonas corrugata]
MKHAKTALASKPQHQRRVVILALPPVDALDVIGPAEVFAFANSLHQGSTAPYLLELVSSNDQLQITSHTGIALTAHRTLEDERDTDHEIDTLIVTSGWNPTTQLEPAAIEWIQTQSSSVRRVCSICVGAFALAHAGVLNGRKATTHWRMARDLADRYPQVQVDPNPIWVKDGHIYTSAGISAGIDLALALVGEDLGEDVALEVAKNLVLFLRRPGGQAQFSIALKSQQAAGSSLDDLCVWISEHIDKNLTVEILADKMATSVRTLIRMFQRDLRTTPGKYIEDVRLEAVCRALELGGRSTEDIARICGYHSIDVLRKAFVRRFGISPKDYAQRFTHAGGGG